MRTLILANGTPPSRGLAQKFAAWSELRIATDGAAHQAAALGVAPEIVCGDFDSVEMAQAKRALPLAEWVATPDQDKADLEKAILLAIGRGATEITILGANGGRIDHTLANFALLLRYGRKIPLRIMEDGAETWPVSGVSVFAAERGDTVSLISMDGAARVSVSGVRWPLDDFPLPIGTLGVSNEATGGKVTLTVTDGVILACYLFPLSATNPSL